MSSGFLRRAEVIIGPLKDYEGGGNESSALRIVADGSSDGFRIQAKVRKTITGEPNELNIAIWGLSLETRQRVRAGFSRVLLRAGYENDPSQTGIAQVGSGALLAVVPRRDGPDNILSLLAFDGYGGMVRGAYTKAFGGNVPVADVIRDLAGSLLGTTVGRVDVPGVLYRKGIHLTGSSVDCLNRLADQFGFTWSVQDGVFQALRDDGGDTGSAFSFDSGSNLIAAAPILNGPLQAQIGVEIESRFDARVKPGDRCNVRSVVNPSLDGSYVATTVESAFDSHGPAGTKIQSLRWF